MEILPFTLLGLGFLLGIRHAFDIDHIAAISTIVSQHKSIKKSSLIGLFWGIGHSLALLAAALIFLVFRKSISANLSSVFEYVVGVMLVILGINVLLTINKNKIHLHKHKHDNFKHIHLHSHKPIKNHRHEHIPLKQSFIVGIVHGLAGSAAITLLVLATINSFFIALIYIIIFASGTMLGMIIFSSIIALPFKLMQNRFQKVQNLLSIGSGLFSIIIGLMMVI